MTRSEILADIGKTKAEIQRLQEHLADIEKTVEQEETVTRFEPEIDEEYSFITTAGNICTVCWRDNGDESLDESRQKICNVFRPTLSDNLNKYVRDVFRVQNRLMQLHEELCPERWIDFGNCSTKKAFVYFDTTRRVWIYDTYIRINCCGVPFTADTAYKACEILNAERFMMDEK